MSIVRTVVNDISGLPRSIGPGDVLLGGDIFPATIATNAINITGQQLGSGFIQRTTTGAGTDTIDTAANVIAALGGTSGLTPGLTWRIRWVQNAAFAITVQATANTGVTVSSGTVNASSVKEFLVSVVNGTPARTVLALTTNASAVLTGLSSADLAALSPGMVVTNAVAGQQGNTILAVNLTAGTVTMSGNSNATNTTPVSINFSPVITVQGIGQGLL